MITTGRLLSSARRGTLGAPGSDSPCLNAGPAADTAGTGRMFAPSEASVAS